MPTVAETLEAMHRAEKDTRLYGPKSSPLLVDIIYEATQRERDRCLKAVDDQPEWSSAIVRATKASIRKRIEEG